MKADLSENLAECPFIGCDGDLIYIGHSIDKGNQHNNIAPVLAMELACTNCKTLVKHVSQYKYSEATRP